MAMKLSKGKTEFVDNFNKLYSLRGTQVTIDFPENGDDVAMASVPVLSPARGIFVENVTGGVREKILQALTVGAVGSGDLAMAVYGDRREATFNKLRKMLGRLKTEGLVDSPSKGIWKRCG